MSASPIPSAPSSVHTRASGVALILLGIALFLLIRRYAGIQQDAILYLGQAFLHRAPDVFGGDLFFAHGSQARYTLFPWLLSAAMRVFEPAALLFWCAMATMLGFAATSWYALRGILPAAQRHWAWLGVLCLPSWYGMASMFSYAEPFLTPRSIAEPMCLLGIGLLARGRTWRGLACFALAAAFHPLQALAGSVTAWTWLVGRDRRWLHAAWLVLPTGALALAGVAPFDHALHVLDGDWLLVLRATTGQLFVTGWSSADYCVLALDVALLLLARQAFRIAFGTWCVAALVALALSVGASVLLVDMLHLQLAAELQLWRAHWLAHFFAMAALPLLLLRDAREAATPRMLLLVLAALLAWGANWAWLPLAALYAVWPRLAGRMPARVVKMLGGVFAIGIAMLVVGHVMTVLVAFRATGMRMDLYPVDRQLLAYPLFALGLPFACVMAWTRSTPRPRTWMMMLLCPLAVFAALRWDARAPVQRAVEASAGTPAIFGSHIPPSAQVYWDTDSLLGTWLVLQRASYFNQAQLAGYVFNRSTMVDGQYRINQLLPLLQASAACRQMEASPGCHIPAPVLRSVCSRSRAVPPDFLILPYPQPQRALGTWTITDPRSSAPLAIYRLFDCASLRTLKD